MDGLWMDRVSKVSASLQEIGIITPYAAQARLLRRSLGCPGKRPDVGNVEVSSVDGFQGREKDSKLGNGS